MSRRYPRRAHGGAQSPQWRVDPGHQAGIETLTEVVATLYRLDRDSVVARLLDDYAVVAEHLAEREVATIADPGDHGSLAEGVIIGTVLGDVVLRALRRITHEGAWARRSGASPSPEAVDESTRDHGNPT